MNTFIQGFNNGFMHGMLGKIGAFGCCGIFGGFNMCNPFMSYNITPMFFTPTYNMGGFIPYSSPLFNMPSVFNYTVPQMNFTDAGSNASLYDFNFSSFGVKFSKSTFEPDASKKNDKEGKREKLDESKELKDLKESNESESPGESKVIVKPKPPNEIATISYPIRKDCDFNKMLEFVFAKEGGYNPNDCGKPGNYGIRQDSYDSYRRKNGLSLQSVKKITKEEATKIYYEEYYVASGADKIKDPRMALYVFDSAVNMGVGAAKELYKQSAGDLDRFETLRKNRYENIANAKPDRKKYLKAWKKRVDDAEKFANKEFIV